MSTSFWKSGHTPTLFSAFLYFDISFMVWYLLGPLAVQIATNLELDAQQRGIMVATPILSGALLRLLQNIDRSPHEDKYRSVRAGWENRW